MTGSSNSQLVEVVSWQAVGLDIRGPHIVDLARSPYYREHPELHPKYAAVHRRMRTTHILWCFTKDREWMQNDLNPRDRWTLRVPRERLALVDEDSADQLAKRRVSAEAAWDQIFVEELDDRRRISAVVACPVDVWVVESPPLWRVS